MLMETKARVCQTLQLICTIRLDLRLSALLEIYRKEYEKGGEGARRPSLDFDFPDFLSGPHSNTKFTKLFSILDFDAQDKKNFDGKLDELDDIVDAAADASRALAP